MPTHYDRNGIKKRKCQKKTSLIASESEKYIHQLLSFYEEKFHESEGHYEVTYIAPVRAFLRYLHFLTKNTYYCCLVGDDYSMENTLMEVQLSIGRLMGILSTGYISDAAKEFIEIPKDKLDELCTCDDD